MYRLKDAKTIHQLIISNVDQSVKNQIKFRFIDLLAYNYFGPDAI